MRFLETGPSVPNELLIARDEGRVVFFCGAGVSRAYAGLTDFLGLAEDVLQGLRVSVDDPTRRILVEAREVEKRIGVGGLIAADRIFGLLESQFTVSDIHEMVASSLRTDDSTDLTAHRILTELSTTSEGKIGLVTTNFDRLFAQAVPGTLISRPDDLPNLSDNDDFSGIVHLHGIANTEFDGPEKGGFVLSTSEFGRAYLSEAWAARFIREIVERYMVVFVGYGADDPPVHYLLEGIKGQPRNNSRLFAFHSGMSSDATSRWRNRGVNSIPYDASDGHQPLWDTLKAWARRATNHEQWQQEVFDRAEAGPRDLSPFERGQLAHIVSTRAGARAFASRTQPLPAEWICVFDRYRRHAAAGQNRIFNKKREFVDPFIAYGIDSDAATGGIDIESGEVRRNTPSDAWDAFALQTDDHPVRGSGAISSFRGLTADEPAPLPSRLHQLAVWLRNVSDQPASVWWAAHQGGLHPTVKMLIQSKLERPEAGKSAGLISRAWRLSFDAWLTNEQENDDRWYTIERAIGHNGWSEFLLRQVAEISRPHLTAKGTLWRKLPPHSGEDGVAMYDFVTLDVNYPDGICDLEVPDAWLELTIREVRKNLELGMRLEHEIGGSGLQSLSPITEDPPERGYRSGREMGINKHILFFASLFGRLVRWDAAAARSEWRSWIKDDPGVFGKLRIWAFGQSSVVRHDEMASAFSEFSVNEFWSVHHQRDLLLSLKERWGDMPGDFRCAVEERILEGPPQWDQETEEDYLVKKSERVAIRLQWLVSNGCELSVDVAAKMENILSLSPRSLEDTAKGAADSIEGWGGRTQTEEEFSSLLDIPISKVLDRAQELNDVEEFLVRYDPFGGLSKKYPLRALSTLRNAARQNEFPTWAWSKFLDRGVQDEDPKRLQSLVGLQILKMPEAVLMELVQPIANWLSNNGEKLVAEGEQIFFDLVEKLTILLRISSEGASLGLDRDRQKLRWVDKSINSPTGRLAEALVGHESVQNMDVGEGLPKLWAERANELLSLSGDAGRFALVVFLRSFGWFCRVDPVWADDHLGRVLTADNPDDRAAAWDGILSNPTLNNDVLERIGSGLLRAAQEKSISESFTGNFAVCLLVAWAGIGKEGRTFVSSEDFRDAVLEGGEKLRLSVIWHIRRASVEDAEEWSEKSETFFEDVWPRQLSIRSSEISARICEYIFSDPDRVRIRAQIASRFLSVISAHRGGMFIRSEEARSNPRELLEVLCIVLPEETESWPVEMEEVFQYMVADNSLKSDRRLIDLRRRWNSR